MNFTEKEIQNAFWRLLEERPFAKITVKAVVERCGVNRNTFYYHFQDLRALLRKSVLSWLEGLSAGGLSAEAAVAALLRRRTAVLHLYRSLPREAFTGELAVWARCAVNLWAGRVDCEPLLLTCRFALEGFILEWLEGGMDPTFAKNLPLCAALLKGCPPAKPPRRAQNA